jgi:glutathione S-transferase
VRTHRLHTIDPYLLMLELYQAEDCPYSAKVREALTEHGVSFVAHNPRTHGGDVRNEQAQAELETLGGEDQIPFLVDQRRGETLYESDEIVAYVEEHYG